MIECANKNPYSVLLQKKLSAIIYLNESRVMGSWKTAQYEDIREDTDMSKTRGRVTLPSESGFFNETRELMERWGADAIRDSDGTKLDLSLIHI